MCVPALFICQAQAVQTHLCGHAPRYKAVWLCWCKYKQRLYTHTDGPHYATARPRSLGEGQGPGTGQTRPVTGCNHTPRALIHRHAINKASNCQFRRLLFTSLCICPAVCGCCLSTKWQQQDPQLPQFPTLLVTTKNRTPCTTLRIRSIAHMSTCIYSMPFSADYLFLPAISAVSLDYCYYWWCRYFAAA